MVMVVVFMMIIVVVVIIRNMIIVVVVVWNSIIVVVVVIVMIIIDNWGWISIDNVRRMTMMSMIIILNIWIVGSVVGLTVDIAGLSIPVSCVINWVKVS